MTHLATWAGHEFAVQVQLDFGESAGSLPVGLALLPEIAEEIGHGRRTILCGRT